MSDRAQPDSRTDLARRYADALTGRAAFDCRSGLFLAAPRPGFVLHDLVPELQARGILTVYVDLSDRLRDPAALVADALKAALRDAQGWLSAGLERLGIGPRVAFDVEGIGAGQGPTLTQALRVLAERANKPVTLIIDEAERAATTEAGANMMHALKAARDALGHAEAGATPRLMLVFAGSDRGALASLVLRRDQPFFGAEIV